MKRVLTLLFIGSCQPLVQGQITISSHPHPLFIQYGTAFTLTCNYNSYTFHSWIHPTGGGLSSSNERFQVNNVGDAHIATLLVLSATIEDQGVYVCQAVTENNIVHNQTISAMLFEEVQIVTESMLSYQARLCEPVVLNCTALYHDRVTWRKVTSHDERAREVTNSSDGRVTVLSDRLVIHEAKLSDNGTYLCYASNRVSNVEIMAYLDIETSLDLMPHATTIHIDDTGINFTEISFSWDPLISQQCSDVLYVVNASNCSTCLISSNLTTAIMSCIMVRDETVNPCPDGNHSCMFAVQTLVYGRVIGHQTVLLNVQLSDLIEEFVNIEFNQTASTIECSFHIQQENSLKSCSILFGPGEDCRNLSQSRRGKSLTNSSEIIVNLNIEQDSNGNKLYCFHVTATNGTFTVVMKRVFKLYSSGNPLSPTSDSVSCNPADLSNRFVLDPNTVMCGVNSFFPLRTENGIVCYSGNNVGAIAVYSCLDCRFKDSSNEIFIRRCTEYGKWSGTIPQCDCTKGYFIGVDTLAISVGAGFLILSTMIFAFIVQSVALHRIRAKLQRTLSTSTRVDQDQVYEEVNVHHAHVCPADIDTQTNIAYATHCKL